MDYFHRTNIIGVAAGKGGVGKSTVAVYYGLALAQKGYKVGFLDADLYGPSLCHMLSVKELAKEHKGKIIPARAQNCAIMSLALFDKNKEPAMMRAPIVNEIVQQFFHLVEWGELDYLVVDFPPGTGDIPLTLLQQIPISSMIVVTMPQQVSVLDVRKMLQMLSKSNVPIGGVVENMSYWEDPLGKKFTLFGEGGGEILAKEFSLPLLGQIPLDPAFALPFNNQKWMETKGWKVMQQIVASQADHITRNIFPPFELFWDQDNDR